MASTSVPKEYLSALRSYWEGRTQTAIEHLSLLLADEPERSDRFKMYRLWIEILAELNELGTLNSLSDHLHVLSLMTPSDAETYMALRGIIALELDEISAAHLYAKGVKANQTNPYCEELRYRIKARMKTGPVSTSLSDNVNQLEDYYHLSLVAQVASLQNNLALTEKIVKRTNKLFNNAPLHLNIQAHEALESKDYEKAAYFGALLNDLYPTRFDYGVLTGYALLHAKRSKEAIALLERMLATGADRDPDVTSLLSQAHAQQFTATRDKEQLQKSKYYESKTRDNLEERGMGAIFYQSATTQTKQHASEASMKPWLVKLNAAAYHRVREMDKGEIEMAAFPVDRAASPGDIVFLAGDDYRGGESWRIAAVLKVETTPHFDPINGFEAQMSVVCHPQMSIPFDVNIESGARVESGVIELDYDAIDLMTNAVQSYCEVDVSGDAILVELEKVRMSS